MARTLKLVLGVVVAVALVLPGAALAQWTDKGAPLVANATVPLTGGFGYTGSLGGVNCTNNVTATLTLTAGTTTGSFDDFTPTLANCDLTGGLAATCTALTAAHSKNYVLHATGEDLVITDFHLTTTFSGGFLCPKTMTLSGNLTVVALTRYAISYLTAEGTLAASVGGNVSVHGTLGPVNASDKETYGF